jgi:hypothetical protein
MFLVCGRMWGPEVLRGYVATVSCCALTLHVEFLAPYRPRGFVADTNVEVAASLRVVMAAR